VIPKSKTPERIWSNLKGDFQLTVEEVHEIESIDKKGRYNDPSNSFRYNFFADLDGKE
jgi:alcohol dehydrogenase (NADP+)